MEEGTLSLSEYDPPRPIVEAIVRAALAEDLGLLGDITSIAGVVEDSHARAVLRSRGDGVLAGTACATETFHQLDPSVTITWHVVDGEPLAGGTDIGHVEGLTRSILAGERVALNFLCHLSGVATLTRRYVRSARGQCRILDTRKTLPGLRALQKAAVRAGGGFNHRDSLSDAVLFKDNHLALLGVTRAVERARARWPGRTVEVECDSLDQVDEALSVGVERIMLDNMTPEEVREAAAFVGGRIPIEVSGGVTLETVGSYAAAGVDFISVGALTHSARVLDIGLDFD
jgi:nicotinate-nucleotide pyrophosphorylase (carboxylating)